MSAGSSRPPAPPPMQEPDPELAPLYRAAGLVLTWGFRLAAALLAGGLLLAAIRDESISKEAEPLSEILSLLLDGHSTALVDLSILAMILTPVATVLVIAVGFLRLNDRRYALASLFVLAVLGVSIAISLVR